MRPPHEQRAIDANRNSTLSNSLTLRFGDNSFDFLDPLDTIVESRSRANNVQLSYLLYNTLYTYTHADSLSEHTWRRPPASSLIRSEQPPINLELASLNYQGGQRD
eukprot:SAG31_NODE_657_length_13108_cov_3.079330_3_plen_106_part_00